jgi:hypothetical protein
MNKLKDLLGRGEHVIEILVIIKGMGYDVYGSTKSFVECTGIIMVFQNRLLIIDRRGVSIMSRVFLGL